MSDLAISWLRGVVPGAWSALVTALIAWAASSAPWLLELLDVLNVELDSPAAVAFVMALVLAAWLALWRCIEPHVPDWLSRIAMGSARTPTYLGALPEVLYSTGDRVLLLDGAEVTIGAAILQSNASVPSYTVGHPSGRQGTVRQTDVLRLVSRAE